MNEKLDPNATTILANAESIAKDHKQNLVDAEHLLLSLINFSPKLISALHVDNAEFSQKLSNLLLHKDKSALEKRLPIITTSLCLQRILDLAWDEASLINQQNIQDVHLLAGILREGKNPAAKLLSEAKSHITPEDLLKELYISLGVLADQDNHTELAQTYFGRVFALDSSDARIPRVYIDILKGRKKGKRSGLSRFDEYSIIDTSEVIEESSVSFDIVAGINDPSSEYYRIRRIFELTFLYPEQYKELAVDYNIANMSTILMFGPTGVGKTFICRAMAGEYTQRTGKKLTFINARLSSVLDKWVGNTEKNISRLVEIAIERSPSLLLLDEIDSLGRDRGQSSEKYQRDWVNHLLLEMDRLRNAKKTVLVIACTNTISGVDPALRRRLGSPIIIPMPSEIMRSELFRLYIERASPSVRLDIN